jgi:hypothetical protein
VTADGLLNVDTDYYVEVAASVPTAFVLPSATLACGRDYIVKNLTNNAATLFATPPGVFEGQTSYTLTTSGRAVHFLSDCVNWQVISAY